MRLSLNILQVIGFVNALKMTGLVVSEYQSFLLKRLLDLLIKCRTMARGDSD